MTLDLGWIGGILGFIESRVERIEVAAVQMLLNHTESFAKPLEMNDFTFSKETDGVADFRIFDDTEDIVIGRAGFLLCCQILK